MTLAPPAVPGLEALNSAAQAAGQQAENNLTAYQQSHPELYGGQETSAVPQGGAVGPTGAVAGYAAPAQPYQPPAPQQGLLGQIGGGLGALGNLITRPSSGYGVGVPSGQGTAPPPELSAFNYAGQATEIPGAREAVNRYVAPAVNLLAPWASLPQQAIQQAGGPQLPSTGEIAASQIPTNLRDIALTAAPFAGEIGRGVGALAENPALRELGGRVLTEEAGGIRLPGGAPRVAGAPGGTIDEAAYTDLLDKVTGKALAGEDARYWYEQSGRYLSALANGNPELGDKLARIVAITSTDTSVGGQGPFILRALRQYLDGQPFTGMRYGSVSTALENALRVPEPQWDATVVRWLRSGNENAQKIGNFYLDHLDEINPSKAAALREASGATMTIDRWMNRAFGYNTDTRTEQQYGFMSRATNAIAQRLGWTPKQVQAAIWVSQKMDIEGGTLATAATDYSGALQRHQAQLYLETVPSAGNPRASQGMIQGLAQATPEVRAEYARTIDQAFQDGAGNDVLAREIGLPVEGQHAQPLAGTAIGGEKFGLVDPAQAEKITDYAVAKAQILGMDQAVWTRPFVDPSQGLHNGIRVNLGRVATTEELTRLRSLVPDMVVQPVDGGVWIFREPEAADMLARRGGASKFPEVVASNRQAVSRAATAADQIWDNVPSQTFATDGRRVDVNAYSGTGALDRPNVREAISSITDRVATADSAFAQKQGWLRTVAGGAETPEEAAARLKARGEAGGVRLPFGGEKPPVEPPTTPIGKLTAAIENAGKATPEQEAMFAAERAQRTARGAGALESGIAQGQGQQAFQQARGAMAGEFQRPSFTVPDFAPEDAHALYQQIGTADNVRFYDRVNAESALTDLLGGRIPQPAQLTALRKVFPQEADALFKAVQNKQGFDLWREVKGIMGAPQALQTFLDVSAPGRQGAVLGWANPIETGKSILPMVKAFGSEEAAIASSRRIETAPWFAHGNDGLGAADAGLHLYGGETFAPGLERAGGYAGLNESFVSRMLQRVPFMRGSERAFSTFLNEQGFRVYEKEAQNLFDSGIKDPDQYRALANVINHARGYGDIKVGEFAQGVNAFYSARNFTSRFQVLTDPLTNFRNPAARNLAAKNLAGFIAGNLSVLGLIAETGNMTGLWSVNFDPRSSDWGKIKIGNTRIDPWAGFGPIVRLAARTATGETMTQGGDIRPTRPSTEVLRFFQNKESPAANILATKILGQAEFPGQHLGANLQTATNLFTPFIIQDVADALKYGNVFNAAVAAPAGGVGLGVQSYAPPVADQRDQAARALGLANFDAASDAQKRQINDQIGYQQSPFFTSSLKTAEDADRAVSQYWGKPGYAIEFNNLPRSITESKETRQAWDDSKQLLDTYFNHTGQMVTRDELAASGYKLPTQTQGESAADYQQKVADSTQRAYRALAQKKNPQLDAWIAWWGGGDTLQSSAAYAELQKLWKAYGSKPPAGGDKWGVKLAEGAK